MHANEPDFNSLFPVMRIKCPHCNEVAVFGLGEQVAYFTKVLGVGIGRMSENLIRCGACGYKEFVRKSDFSGWRSLGDKFRELEAGDITDEDFNSYLATVEIPELQELQAASATWECKCGEENPPNFSHCWKCGAESSVEPTELRERPIDLADRHPWEH